VKITADDLPPNVVGIVRFGSHARGDASENSDLDICVFVNHLTPELLQAARASNLPYIIKQKNLEITIYDVETANFMASSGSLFLWHLKSEGRIEYQANHFVNDLLRQLRPPTNLGEELGIHRDLFNLVNSRRSDGDYCDAFDLSALYTVIRNVSILLCAAAGELRFGKLDAFEFVTGMYGNLGLSFRDFKILHDANLSYTRGVHTDLPSAVAVTSLVAAVGEFVKHAEPIIAKVAR